MGRVALSEVLETIEQLDPDELRQVQQAVHRRLGQQDETRAREAFHRALLESGLVTEIKSPPLHPTRERRLVPIQGKPLSETVIEERR